jgi:RHS repeat-associated protein
MLHSSGPIADNNPFRFSTKFFDIETDLYYYGYRFYSPNLGRWINRDPIEEDGGFNLFVFSYNNPVNLFDALGTFCTGEWIKELEVNVGLPSIYPSAAAYGESVLGDKTGGTVNPKAFWWFESTYDIYSDFNIDGELDCCCGGNQFTSKISIVIPTGFKLRKIDEGYEIGFKVLPSGKLRNLYRIMREISFGKKTVENTKLLSDILETLLGLDELIDYFNEQKGVVIDRIQNSANEFCFCSQYINEIELGRVWFPPLQIGKKSFLSGEEKLGIELPSFVN